jgi:hypothetical protein
MVLAERQPHPGQATSRVRPSNVYRELMHGTA